MATKTDLQDWVQGAVKSAGGAETLVNVARHIWKHHEAELRASGDLLYTWQYDMRWAATALRKQGVLLAAESSPRGKWILKGS